MSTDALYNDLSGFYDLLCADIDYHAQSTAAHRLNQLFGNQGRCHLDLACGTGPHIRYLLDLGYHSTGLDLNQPMLDLAKIRCPEAEFICQDMSQLGFHETFDLITCFLYSIHYNQSLELLENCFKSISCSLNKNGILIFNAVDKTKIDNSLRVNHTVTDKDNRFSFQSNWYYSGQGENQTLNLTIEKSDGVRHQVWQDAHTMVAASFDEINAMLTPYFDVHMFEHDYETITPWDTQSGNAVFVCINKTKMAPIS